MALLYADASALVKLVRDEPESPALRAFITGADLASCDLVLAEVPRAIRRAAALDSRLDLEVLVARAGEVIEAVALVPLDRALLLAAGALAEPSLGALEAIHVAAAASLTQIDGFLGYDMRQAAAARLAGLRTFAPGA
jgi:predicted nucleic acid-binding protein